MGNYTIFLKFENPRRGRQERNLSENDPKILDLKSSSEQIIFRKLSLGAPDLVGNIFAQCKSAGCRPRLLGVCIKAMKQYRKTEHITGHTRKRDKLKLFCIEPRILISDGIFKKKTATKGLS